MQTQIDIYTNSDGTANEGITFEELCNFCDSIEVSKSEEVTAAKEIKNEEVEDYSKGRIVIVTHNKVKANVKNAVSEVIAKLKKSSTVALKNLYKRNNKKEASAFYDRELLISNAISFTSEGITYEEAKKKETFEATVVKDTKSGKLSWSDLKEIRRLFNIKAYEVIDIRNEDNELIEVKKVVSKDSAYSYKEIGDIFKLSHIFARNICLNKVYKEKKS